jgi:signal transduction histidine kinase
VIGAPYEDETTRAPVERRVRPDPAQRDRARLAVLYDAGRLFASSRDFGTVLRELGELVVPAIGDWCLVHLGDGHVGEASDRRVVVPLVVRNRVIGVLTFGRNEPEYDRDDLAFGDELARRVASYVDSVMLLREVRSLEKRNANLDEFAYVTSHDLRAPLRGISNLSAWIEEDLGDRMTERGREHVKLLRGRVHRLEDLIDGVLEYSRAGRVPDEPVELEVAPLVREVVELLAPPRHVDIRIGANLPVIRCARVPLQQVLMNLIANAIKHNDKARPKIEIAAEPTADGWELYVRDNGPGIAPRHHSQIWGLFKTLVANDKCESTGIGLAIVRKIVEAHGGRAWVESAEGNGATFRFTWPNAPLPQRTWR